MLPRGEVWERGCTCLQKTPDKFEGDDWMNKMNQVRHQTHMGELIKYGFLPSCPHPPEILIL